MIEEKERREEQGARGVSSRRAIYAARLEFTTIFMKPKPVGNAYEPNKQNT